MSYKRLTKNHPLDKKLRALEAYMVDNKISINYEYNKFTVTDTETGEGAHLVDIEGNEVDNVPYMFETKLIKDYE